MQGLAVLPDRVEPVTIRIDNGLIAAIEPIPPDPAHPYLLPGLIDLHTDNLERQVQPRPGARYPGRAAFLAHDAQCAAAGITTVFDSLCLGDLGFDEDRPRTTQEGLADLAALTARHALRADHLLHLRCEIPAPDVVSLLQSCLSHKQLRFASLMDHTPGHGQYTDLPRYTSMRRRDGEPEAEIPARISRLQAQRAQTYAANRSALLDLLRPLALPLASHDDFSPDDIAANHRDGITVAEFPVTLEAATAARAHGHAIIAGAPNLVRGASHTGNVSVSTMLRHGLMDALASDYVPQSLLDAVFIAHQSHGLKLPQAAALATVTPARIARLTDRGRLAPGMRADIIEVTLIDTVPRVTATWRQGLRVA